MGAHSSELARQTRSPEEAEAPGWLECGQQAAGIQVGLCPRGTVESSAQRAVTAASPWTICSTHAGTQRTQSRCTLCSGPAAAGHHASGVCLVPEPSLRLHSWHRRPSRSGFHCTQAASGAETDQMTSCSVAVFCLRLSLFYCVPPNYILKP